MEPTRLWNKNFVQLLTIELMLQFGLYITRPILSNYSVELGASLTLAGFFAGLMATAALCIRPVSGIASDRFSKKVLLVISAGLFALSAFGLALFRSLIAMGVFLCIQGFAFAFKSSIVVAMSKLVVPQKYVLSAVGWMGVAYTTSCALGPGIGAFLSDLYGYQFLFWIAAAMLTTGFVLAVFFKEPAGAEAHKEVGKKTSDGQGGVGLSEVFHIPTIPFSVAAGLLMIAQGTTASFLVLVGQMRGIEGAAIYFIVYSLVTTAARPIAGRLGDEYGAKKIVPVAMVIACIGMIVMAFGYNLVLVLIAAACMGAGQGSAFALIQGDSVKKVAPELTARAANTFYIGPDLGMGLGPVLGGWFMSMFGIEAMFLYTAVCVVIGLVLFVSAKAKAEKAAA